MYVNFICPKEKALTGADDFIRAFDAWENYDVLCQFYDSCPECQSFPREEYFSEGSQDHWEDYVIWQDGVIAARAGVWKENDAAWEVAGVITRPEYRGRGYAKRLVRYCIGVIHARGKDAILSTHETNGAMIRAALAAGFEIRE